MRNKPYNRLTEDQRKQRKESKNIKPRKPLSTEAREKKKLNERLYRLNFKDDYNQDRRERYERYKQNNPHYLLPYNFRSLIGNGLKKGGYSKKSRSCEILGCSFEDLKIHLESQFEPWMSWNNYGNWNGIPTERKTAWDIDHIIPTSSATSEEEIYKLNHYTNLQPLCSYVNRYIKGDKIDFIR